MILMHVLHSWAFVYQYLFLGRVETRGSWLIKLCFKVRLRWITLSSQCAIYLIVTCSGGRDLSWCKHSWRTLWERQFGPHGLLSRPAGRGRGVRHQPAGHVASAARSYCTFSGLYAWVCAACFLVSCHWGTEIICRYKEFLSFVYGELFEVSITVNLVGIKVFSLQKFLFRYSS